MILALDFGDNGIHQVELPHVTEDDFITIEQFFDGLLTNSKLKAREAIAHAFLFALTRCPAENPSDLYHHVLYRIYLRKKRGTNPEQSWVRASGEAFEITIANLYNPVLLEAGMRMLPLFSRDSKAQVLERMGLGGRVGSSKMDMAIEKQGTGKGISTQGYGIVGAVHAKASLAERVSDDIPASRIIMAEGFLSVLSTLDVKSFPPPHGDLVNRGELGSPSRPSDKRRYIEEHGDFSACFSYNTRTVPSAATTISGKRIFVERLRHNPQGDAFVQFLISATS